MQENKPMVTVNKFIVYKSSLTKQYKDFLSIHMIHFFLNKLFCVAKLHFKVMIYLIVYKCWTIR
jgi:hypothetical protein